MTRTGRLTYAFLFYRPYVCFVKRTLQLNSNSADNAMRHLRGLVNVIVRRRKSDRTVAES